MLEHIERLKAWQALDLPPASSGLVHQNRLLKIAREGGQMTPADLAKFERSGVRRLWWRSPSRAWPPSPTKSSTCTTASRANCSTPPKQASAAVPGIRQGHQRQGAVVRAHRPCADRRQTIGPRPVAAIEGVIILGCLRRKCHRSAETRGSPGLDFLHRRELRHAYARYAEFLAVLKLRALRCQRCADAIEGCAA